jgi:ferredoxin-NADP reductase
MAGAAVVWRGAMVVGVIEETARARTIVLEVPGWPGHSAGQHVDERLTAEDGYQTQRSYSIASAPEAARLALTVERIDDGEVSAYLTGELGVVDEAALSDRRVLHLADPRRGRCCSSPGARAWCR